MPPLHETTGAEFPQLMSLVNYKDPNLKIDVNRNRQCSAIYRTECYVNMSQVSGAAEEFLYLSNKWWWKKRVLSELAFQTFSYFFPGLLHDVHHFFPLVLIPLPSLNDLALRH